MGKWLDRFAYWPDKPPEPYTPPRYSTAATPDPWLWVEVAAGSPAGASAVPFTTWVHCVSRALVDLREQGVDLEVPVSSVVPYLDHN